MTGSHLILRPATAQEIWNIHDLNSASWAGDLDVETYHAREQTLASTPLTRNGGLSAWVLVDPADDPHKILSSCETTRKDALVSIPHVDGNTFSTVKRVTAHGVGSVFTPEEHRGKGYAGIMLQLLAQTLKKENAEGFSVLYSDIGKVSVFVYIEHCKGRKDMVRCSLGLSQKFYARYGWLPHRSTHLEFPALESGTLAGVKLLRSTDVPALCVKDIAAVKEKLSRPSIDLKTKVAFIPNYQTLEWHWAREEFVAPVLRKHIDLKPEFKGAITADGKRWIIWNRDFGKISQLYIIRYVNLSRSLDEAKEEEQLAHLFLAAGLEARKWGLQKVTMWNPDEVCIRAARRAAGSTVEVIDRENDSVASLMMHHSKIGSDPEKVEWLANEKFGWC
jgi:hypothetical protein